MKNNSNVKSKKQRGMIFVFVVGALNLMHGKKAYSNPTEQCLSRQSSEESFYSARSASSAVENCPNPVSNKSSLPIAQVVPERPQDFEYFKQEGDTIFFAVKKYKGFEFSMRVTETSKTIIVLYYEDEENDELYSCFLTFSFKIYNYNHNSHNYLGIPCIEGEVFKSDLRTYKDRCNLVLFNRLIKGVELILDDNFIPNLNEVFDNPEDTSNIYTPELKEEFINTFIPTLNKLIKKFIINNPKTAISSITSLLDKKDEKNYYANNRLKYIFNLLQDEDFIDFNYAFFQKIFKLIDSKNDDSLADFCTKYHKEISSLYFFTVNALHIDPKKQKDFFEEFYAFFTKEQLSKLLRKYPHLSSEKVLTHLAELQ